MCSCSEKETALDVVGKHLATSVPAAKILPLGRFLQDRIPEPKNTKIRFWAKSRFLQRRIPAFFGLKKSGFSFSCPPRPDFRANFDTMPSPDF